MTSSTPWADNASRRADASAWSRHVTPIDLRWWPPDAALSLVPTTADTTCSAALEFAPSSTAVMSKTSWSTVTPSAFSPSTSTMRTVVGVIETPNTMSTDSSKYLLRYQDLR